MMKKQIEIAHKACMPSMVEIPEINPGDIINIHVKIKERGKERIQQFQGTIMQIQGDAAHLRTVTVRKVSSGICVERIFPIPSPLIAKIEVKRRAIVRRANLSYLRNLKKQSKTKIKYKI